MNTDRPSPHALRELIPPMTERDPEHFINQARRLQGKRRLAGAGAAITLTVIVGAVGITQLGQQPTIPGHAPTPSQTDAACPVPDPDAVGVPSWADLITWQGRKYLGGVRGSVQTGQVAFTVRCSIIDITNLDQAVKGTFPDRTAVVLRTGAAVYTIEGTDPKCALAAQQEDGQWVTYTASPAPQGC